MNTAPKKGDRVTITAAGKATEVIVEYFCATEGRAGLVAGRMKLKYAAYGRAYVVWRLPTLGGVEPPKAPVPGDHPAFAAAMT